MALSTKRTRSYTVTIFCAALAGSLAMLPVGAQEKMAGPPPIPVGYDAYRMWDQWPLLRLGVRSYMRSTYDRAGRNEAADASHFLYQEREDFNVTLDEEGPGILYFARYNHWHGSPWHYEVDGEDFIVQETSSADPTNPVEGSVFLPEDLFPSPLTWTWSVTKGADLSWVQIPFEQNFRMAYSRTFYGTGYYIFHRYMRDAATTQPLQSWQRQPPPQEVLELIGRAGTDLVEGPPTLSRTFPLGEHREVELFEVKTEAPQRVRGLKLRIPRAQALALSNAFIRIHWDGREHASVDAPLALFFGAGTLYNRDEREYLVKGFPAYIRYAEEHVDLACFFPMPFFKSATITLHQLDPAWQGEVEASLWHEPLGTAPNHNGYFHATYRDHQTPTPGHDLVLLDTQGTEGQEDWSGSFVGTSFIFSHAGILTTLEGDPRFFFDDCQTPSYGTGTEEWGGGGDYWGGENMTLPFAGHPVGAPHPDQARAQDDLIQSAYRFLLADLMPFGKRAIIRLEHGGENQSTEHYRTVTYWYGAPFATLVKTDSLNVGDPASEAAHTYHSPEASETYRITSRYEWGPDTVKGTDEEVYPAHEESGRTTHGASEFTLALRPENHGVLLRRTLDWSVPNQRARVYVRDASSAEGEWELAGEWYEAGSNTCYFSNPRAGELGAPTPVVQTSNRQFRDDEFLVPRSLTQGREAIRLRLEHVPVTRPLLPEMEPVESAWTELRYDAYCYVLPD
jgi:hypothetical protein